jgi:hypothetical protein
MNLLEIFHDYLSELYWEGYPEYLLENDLAAYNFEFKQFSQIYS